MASRLALRISMTSIRRDELEATETKALCMMRVKSASRRAALSCLESCRPGGILSGSSTTAAATTGPASGPRPASSVPATGQMPRLRAASSMEKSGPSGRSKRRRESEDAGRDMRRTSHIHPIPCKSSGRRRMPEERRSARGSGPEMEAGRRHPAGFMNAARQKAALRLHSSESCTPLPDGGTNWSRARFRRVRVSSSRLEAISKRRAICQA